jgi:DNA-binding NtrC family response regulator
MSNMLFCCIGNSDRKAKFENSDLGPIARALLSDSKHYDKAVLLSDAEEKDKSYCERLKKRCLQEDHLKDIEIEMVPFQAGAMDRPELYKVMQEAVDKHSRPNRQRTYLLSSGTPAMHLCWTLLGHTGRYYARLIDASEKEGIKEVPHWVELAHAFIPTLPSDFGQFLVAMGRELVTDDIIGSDVGIQRAKGLASMAAKSKRDDYPVLIFGETGTGKESIARLIHQRGNDPKGEFVAINCGAMTESLLESELFGHVKGAFTGANTAKKGLFQAAGSGGTVFLDEIGEMSPTLQTKLLRVLQEKKVRPVGGAKEEPINDIRIVAATHRSLAAGVGEGWFREDLYYRLNVIEIRLPPLRERLTDLPALARHFIENINNDLRSSELKNVVLTDDAMLPLLKHYWPGNIRELQNTLRRAAIFANHPGQSKAVIDAVLLREVILPPVTGKPGGGWADRPLEQLDLNALLEEVRYHYYQRFRAECPDLSREALAKSMGITLPTLKGFEDGWAAQGKAVGQRQSRSKRNGK